MVYSGASLLDTLELQHFKNESEESILPSQMPSIARQISEVVIEDPAYPSLPPLLLNLAVDAAPGCGGVTWPAGRVSLLHLLRHVSTVSMSLRCPYDPCVFFSNAP